MIIGQVMRSFGTGGAQRSAVNVALSLADMGHKSRLIALGDPGRFALQIAERVPCDALAQHQSALAKLWQLRKLVKARAFEVLHVHGSGSLPFVAAALLHNGAEVALHFTWHDSSNVLAGSWWKQELTRWALDRCESVTASSSAVAARLERVWRNRTVEVMRNGVPDNGALGDTSAAVPIVVWAARIVPEKRPEWFIRTAAKARQAGLKARFVIAGASLPHHQGYFESVRQLARDLNDPVEFVGWLEQPEELYRGAAIAVQTSWTEGLSMTLLEQMMAGLAIVATDVGDTAPALEWGKAGILARPEDEMALSAGVLKLVSDTGARVKLGRAARARALLEYTSQKAAEHNLARYARQLT